MVYGVQARKEGKINTGDNFGGNQGGVRLTDDYWGNAGILGQDFAQNEWQGCREIS